MFRLRRRRDRAATTACIQQAPDRTIPTVVGVVQAALGPMAIITPVWSYTDGSLTHIEVHSGHRLLSLPGYTERISSELTHQLDRAWLCRPNPTGPGLRLAPADADELIHDRLDAVLRTLAAGAATIGVPQVRTGYDADGALERVRIAFDGDSPIDNDTLTTFITRHLPGHWHITWEAGTRAVNLTRLATPSPSTHNNQEQ